MRPGRGLRISAIALLLLVGGCFGPEPQYGWNSPVGPAWLEDRDLLVDPYWEEGDDLQKIERVDRIVRSEAGGADARREFAGVVKYVRLRGESAGHVARLVFDADFVLAGIVFPDGRTLRYTEGGGYREVGYFGFSEPRQYNYALQNILNEDHDLITSEWGGEFDRE